MIDVPQLRNQLHTNVMRVVFTKANGDIRSMVCTLMPEHLPPQKDIEEATTKNRDDVLAVWDIEAKGWRSFRTESVSSVMEYTETEMMYAKG